MQTEKYKKPGRPLKSRIHFSNTEIWTYKVGVSNIKIKPPDLMSVYIVGLNEFTGDPNAESISYLMHRGDTYEALIEYDIGLGGKTWGIKPSQVKTWIDQNLRKNND